MNVSIHQAAAALNANARWQECISQNLAASAVPGFKKQAVSFAAFDAALAGARQTGGLNQVLPSPHSATDFQQGEIKATGSPHDLAIEGSGFFEVQLPNGETAYTRNGQFHVNAAGQLVSSQGYLVLSQSGPIQLDLKNPAPFAISADGQVSQGPDVKGRLKITTFEQPQLLQALGSGCYLARDPELRPTVATDAHLHQGYLEGANTTPVLEMTQLLTALRQFEANQRVIQVQDDRLGRTITELGRTN